MNEPQPGIANTPSYPPPPRGVFGTKIPSTVCFAIGLLLFVMPFAELKCSLSKDQGIAFETITRAEASLSNTGLGLAFGNKWKVNMPGFEKFLENQQKGKVGNSIKQTKPNNYAIVALALAFVGLALSFANPGLIAGINMATGILAAAALVGLMIDLKKQMSDVISESDKSAGNSILVLNFTPWFYIAIIALLTAGIFSYLRMQSSIVTT